MNNDIITSLEQLHNKLQRDAFTKGIPYFGGFELTPRCNLSCKMCYVKFKGSNSEYVSDELSTKQWIRIGEEAVNEGTLVIFLTGGEPLIRDDFKQIYEAYSKLGVRLNLFTNGTLINKEIAKWLSQFPPATVDVTLYGSSEETYNNLCGNKLAYKKTIDGIENLLENKINTRIKTTIVQSNYLDFNNIKSIALSYNVEFLSSNLIHGNRCEGIINIQNERLTPEQIFESEINNNNKYNCDIDNLEKIKLEYINIPAMFCSAGKSAFFVNWQGRLLPCPLFSQPFSQPLLDGFLNSWNIIKQKVKEIPSPKLCSHCDIRMFCPVCPPRLYLETGSFDGQSEYICSLARKKMEVISFNKT